jgi:integrase
MASLRKRKGSKVWHAQYYVKDPQTGDLRQVRKSTGHTNKKKAFAAAIEFERNAHGVMQAGSDKAAEAKSILADAIREIERETFTAPAARKYLSKLLFIATGEQMTSYTIETWSAEWLRRKARDSSKATVARYSSHTKGFLNWLGDERRKKPLESVTAHDMRKWQESLSDAGRVGKTVMAYVKDIGAIFRAAIREGIIAYNPCGTTIGDIDTSDSMERLPFTLAEVAALMRAATTPEWAGLILTAAFTGLRLGDAARLSWASVDLEAKKITLIPSKTQKKKLEVCIPIQPDLLAYLEAAPIHDDSPIAPVFPKLSKTRLNAENGLSHQFVGIMRDAGVSRGKTSRDAENRGKGRITYERGFHSLRHTFTSWLRNAGVSEEDRMALTGHSTRESHQIYSHADEAALRDAVSKLPTLESKQS